MGGGSAKGRGVIHALPGGGGAGTERVLGAQGSK